MMRGKRGGEGKERKRQDIRSEGEGQGKIQRMREGSDEEKEGKGRQAWRKRENMDGEGK